MRISVVIPNWNGARILPGCLDGLLAQTLPAHEVIVVDNGSTDGSLELLREAYGWVKVVAWPKNRGFAAAVNEGIRQSQGDGVALLNNDTEPDKAWLAELSLAAERWPEASFFASKLLLFDRRTVLHSAGDFYGTDGVPGNRGVWTEDRGQYDGSVHVFGACAGAALYRKATLDDVGLFDESLGSYCEDVDWNFRALLKGHRCRFVPGARVYHMLSATGGGPIASYFCGRNFLWVLYVNMPGELLRKHAFSIASAQLGFTWQSLRHLREPAARARLRGQWHGLKGLAGLRRKRRQRQACRRVTVASVDSALGRR